MLEGRRCRIRPRAHAVLTGASRRFSFEVESLLILAPIFFLPLPNQIGAGPFHRLFHSEPRQPSSETSLGLDRQQSSEKRTITLEGYA